MSDELTDLSGLIWSTSALERRSSRLEREDKKYRKKK